MGADAAEPPLLHAASSNDVDLAKKLLDAGEDPNQANEMGETALHTVSVSQAWGIAALLIDAGADVNAATRWQYDGHDTLVTRTPLHWAVYTCDAKGVALLLDAGADPLTEAETGETAVDMAKSVGPACHDVLGLLEAAASRRDESL